ncbi:hypothetical protein COLO4_08816 [Corchorus olitorius]|uniref:Uncharacterized protein n=1 Tax=Corchorus olitorius TaxID=93759 RepID=A0A1R3KEF9_9ROSI|nr:hypothetical protein COLO4_08816 [Corchorus olitorius]
MGSEVPRQAAFGRLDVSAAPTVFLFLIKGTLGEPPSSRLRGNSTPILIVLDKSWESSVTDILKT